MRLHFARVSLDLSQAEVADALRVSRESVASYESARVAVPCNYALRFCQMFIVSEKWLADGESSKEFFYGDGRRVMSLIVEPESGQMAGRRLFSFAWDSTLNQVYERLETTVGEGKWRAIFPAGYETLCCKFLLDSKLRQMFKTLALRDKSREPGMPLPSNRFVLSLMDAADEIDIVLSMNEVYLTSHEQTLFDEWAVESGALSSTAARSMSDKKYREFVQLHAVQFLREFYEMQ